MLQDELFDEYRPLLFSIAYRMLSSVMDAEDIVQEAQITGQFMQACANGDLDGLLALLTDDIVAQSDSGGKTTSARLPIFGPDKVARFLLGILKKAPADYAVRLAVVNGQLAIVG